MLLLDLFCGAGGAAMGFWKAGFTVIGVDNRPSPDYPFQCVKADAFEILSDPSWTDMFDAIHASPPCQEFTALKSLGRTQPSYDMITPLRPLLKKTGLPYVIENVVSSPLRDPIMLCGTSFGLGVEEHGWELRRHRLFETNWNLRRRYCHHRRPVIGIYGNNGRHPDYGQSGKWNLSFNRLRLGREAMGMPWARSWYDLTQAIPPAYTEWIGRQLAILISDRRLKRVLEFEIGPRLE
jgi:DNA (cytosine-5)-methyltransferase 1